jgi:hypothetical protein
MKFESTSVVCAADYDKDGDQDLFVGVRMQPYLYGVAVNGYILQNNGKGFFTDISESVAPVLNQIGMITDATWADVDNDSDADIVLVGEYMSVKVLINNAGKFSEESANLGLGKTNGWWTRIKPADLDNDGDLDFVIGNHGLNSRFRADMRHPVCMYVSDFDSNGTVEQIVCTYNGETSYPLALRHDLINQLPSLKKKYNNYDSYKNESFTDIFTPEQVRGALRLEAYTFATSALINNGKSKWTLTALPVEAQYSVTYGILIFDYNGDEIKDILLGGNLFGVKPEMGRYDGSYSTLFNGDGKGNFKFVPNSKSGLHVDGEVRDIFGIEIPNTKSRYIIISRNNESILTYQSVVIK